MGQFGGEDVDRLRIALARIARLVDRQVSGDGMTRTQLSVLGTIARLGPLGIGELADIEGLNPTMLSRVLGKLEADGLVVRSAAVDDRRAVRVSTTPAGRSLQQRLRRQRSQLLAARLTGLPAEQASQLLAALPALETLAEQLTRPQPAKPQASKAQPGKALATDSQPTLAVR
ncbi:MAG TPA: MarR family transcriptional regulator [Jatrophihabitans sp.]|jgi:DNA-binding MarR family transcriptional regulator|uniref:MarR family winged helix-turn-helix transcriptional regulator n=1 Tax=Jatrophihabitans sp. TaxID=1932789 RepID=UPI002F024BDF